MGQQKKKFGRHCCFTVDTVAYVSLSHDQIFIIKLLLNQRVKTEAKKNKKKPNVSSSVHPRNGFSSYTLEKLEKVDFPKHRFGASDKSLVLHHLLSKHTDPQPQRGGGGGEGGDGHRFLSSASGPAV